MKQHEAQSIIYRASKSALTEFYANFTMDGLRFHFAKLNEYTNPTGGALDKIPLNNKFWTKTYVDQFNVLPPKAQNPFAEQAGEQTPKKPKWIFLRRKALYHVANHLLGIGKKAYWTGATGKSTLLGLDIDDHQSDNPTVVQANAVQALRLFVRLTGLRPYPCQSERGINAYLILRKDGLSTKATNELWHSIIRLVNKEAERRGLVATLECKGQARIFDSENAYCGVQFKDPFYSHNPNDDDLYTFWDQLESNVLHGAQLISLLSTLSNKDYCSGQSNSQPASTSPKKDSHDLLLVYQGQWAQRCREWAILGLPCEDSITIVVSELAKWLYFIEHWEIEEHDRFRHVVDLLIQYCLKKHNGFITRLNLGLVNEVKAHVRRIVKSKVRHISESAKAVFSQIRSNKYSDKWLLAPLMLGEKDEPSFIPGPLSPVKFTECCSVSKQPTKWLPKNEYWRTVAANWKYEPDESPLPSKLERAIHRYYKNHKLTIKKPSFTKLVRFLNHLNSNGGEARLGIQSLKKMGFTNYSSRQHIRNLENMGAIQSSGYCPVAGVSKLYKLSSPVVQIFNGIVK